MSAFARESAAPEPQGPFLEWLARTELLGLAACTALVAAGLVMRVRHTHRATLVFLLWNLALAWLPALLAQAVAMTWNRRAARPLALVLALGWLALFPNAPYVITDLIHLHPAPDVPLWFDASLLFATGWTGLLLGYHSLEAMQQIVTRELGPRTSVLFGLSTLALAAVGVQLGRFQRWNSWDLLREPSAIAADLAQALTDPAALRFELFFFSLLVCGYWVWAGSRARHRRAM